MPIAIRRFFGLGSGDKVAFVMEKDDVRILPAGSIVEKTAGSLKSHAPPFTASKLRDVAAEAIAAEAIQRTR